MIRNASTPQGRTWSRSPSEPQDETVLFLTQGSWVRKTRCKRLGVIYRDCTWRCDACSIVPFILQNCSGNGSLIIIKRACDANLRQRWKDRAGNSEGFPECNKQMLEADKEMNLRIEVLEHMEGGALLKLLVNHTTTISTAMPLG